MCNIYEICKDDLLPPGSSCENYQNGDIINITEISAEKIETKKIFYLENYG